MMRAERLMVT